MRDVTDYDIAQSLRCPHWRSPAAFPEYPWDFTNFPLDTVMPRDWCSDCLLAQKIWDDLEVAHWEKTSSLHSLDTHGKTGDRQFKDCPHCGKVALVGFRCPKAYCAIVVLRYDCDVCGAAVDWTKEYQSSMYTVCGTEIKPKFELW